MLSNYSLVNETDYQFFKSNLGIDFNFECLLLTKCIDTFMQILRILLCPVPLPNLLSVVKEFREDILFNCVHRYNENRNNLQLKLNNLQISTTGLLGNLSWRSEHLLANRYN